LKHTQNTGAVGAGYLIGWKRGFSVYLQTSGIFPFDGSSFLRLSSWEMSTSAGAKQICGSSQSAENSSIPSSPRMRCLFTLRPAAPPSVSHNGEIWRALSPRLVPRRGCDKSDVDSIPESSNLYLTVSRLF